jgi:hypothetical protein
LPHQGSELFTKCRNGTDCLPGLGYLLAGWFSWANERSRRFERFKVFGDLHYANFGGEAFCKEHLYKVRKFLPCQARKGSGAFSLFNMENFFYGDYLSLNIVFKK